MSGPRVIRIEKPEPEPKPRQPSVNQDQHLVGGAGVTTPQQHATTSKKIKVVVHEEINDDQRTLHLVDRQGERGSRNPAPTQDRSDTNWRKQDLLERENRLRRSGGFFRQARRDSQKRTDKPAAKAKTLKQTGGARFKFQNQFQLKNSHLQLELKQKKF